MKLTVIPDTVTSNSSISRLSVDGAFECYVLEPPGRIPGGSYDISIQQSQKFGRLMPFLLSVPGHTGIEIHWGNTAKDTKDCLITGKSKAADFVGQSVEAFDALFAKLSAATTKITIEISRDMPIAPTEKVTGALMKTLDMWFNSARGHAVGMLVFTVLAQLYPQYAQALQGVAYAFGYGAVVAGAAPKV